MTRPFRLSVETCTYKLAVPFRIARGGRSEANGLRVTLTDGTATGRGESVPYRRYGESLESCTAQVEAVRPQLEAGLGRNSLREHLPPGAARNAIDLALWDLEAKITGVPVRTLAGLAKAPDPHPTYYTISVGTPAEMAATAGDLVSRFSHLKLKLGGDGDIERVQAVRAAVPEATLLVDANESWQPEHLARYIPAMAQAGVVLIEQPLVAGQDEALAQWRAGPVPLCADESCHTADDLARLLPLYTHINIKLDKTGGLTEALSLAEAAKAQGFGLMVGCMMGSSLALAPAVMLASLAQVVDVDAPLWMAEDVQPALRFVGDRPQWPDPALWG